MYKWKKRIALIKKLCFMDRVRSVCEVIAIREDWLMLGNRNFSRGEMDEINYSWSRDLLRVCDCNLLSYVLQFFI